MEFDRRVQIRVHRRNGTAFGSGYLVAPRLVLTAGHVVETAMGRGPTRVSVCRPDAGKDQFPAAVRWWRVDDEVDAALVEVDAVPEPGGDGLCWEPPESLVDVRTRPPQRWGRIIGTRPHPVTIAGFPRMEKDPRTRDRFDGQISGEIMPGTGSLAGRYEVFSKDATIPVTEGHGTGWSGMSGAALLAESRQSGLLCGVVREDRQAVGGTRLTATPTSALLADKRFSALVAEHGGWQLLLEAAEPVDLLEPAARERDLRSPAMLLRADAEAVTFRGREDELRTLRDWCQRDAEGFSVRVITGPGGQGKSRLARRLSDILREEGWVTGHLRAELHDSDLALPELRSLETALPFLLVVDYADARPSLVRRVIDQLRSCRHRTRLLLLARAGGTWKTDGFTASHADEILARAPTTELASLAPEDGPPGTRTALFTDALGDLADLLEGLPGLPGRPPAGWPMLANSLRAPQDLGEPAYESVLTVQMTALTTLLQNGSAPVETAPEEPAEATLLRHEQRYWVRAADRLGPLDPTTLHRAVAVAALCGAADQAEALAAVGVLPEIPPARAADVAAWLRTLYPPGPDRFWGALQPDRVGEYHASRALLDLDPPLPLAALLACSSTDQQVQLVTVLVRAAVAHHQAGRTARTAGVQQALLNALEATAPGIEVLHQLQIVVPYGNNGLDGLALRLAEDHVAATRQQAEDGSTSAQAALGVALSGLSAALSRTGRHEEALHTAQERLQIWQDLDRTHPTRDVQYAHALGGLSSYLRAVGRDEEALRSLEQGVDLMERLARADPDIRDDLALQLQLLTDFLRNLGHHDKATRALRRSVELTRQLARTDPAYEFELALRSSNLGTLLAQSGHHNEALQVMADSVDAHRRLAHRDPRNREPMLINALTNLSNAQKIVGRSTEARHTMQQAIAIGEHRRRIGLGNSETDTGIVLHTLQLSRWQVEAGSASTFLAALRRALDIWHQLDEASPEYEPVIAELLSRTVNQLTAYGLWETALEPAMTALDIWSRLVCRNPEAHLPGFVLALGARDQVASNVEETSVQADPLLAALDRHLAELLPVAFEAAQSALLHHG
ncbi:AAA family ATPase [Streptomyces sp. NPDC002835]